MRGGVAVVVRGWPRPVFKQFLSKHPRKRDQGACASCEVAHVLTFMTRDWTRLLPAKKDGTKQERVAYLVEFITHRRGSRVAINKAIRELEKLSQSR